MRKTNKEVQKQTVKDMKALVKMMYDSYSLDEIMEAMNAYLRRRG